jgi:hypothetical protein
MSGKTWGNILGKRVLDEVGTEIGTVIEEKENYVHLERGRFRKDDFWIPKYIFEGTPKDGDRELTLAVKKREVNDKYEYIDEPSERKRYQAEQESFMAKGKTTEGSQGQQQRGGTQQTKSGAVMEVPKVHSASIVDELQKLGTLKEQGTITEEEFRKIKQRLLNEMEHSSP